MWVVMNKLIHETTEEFLECGLGLSCQEYSQIFTKALGRPAEVVLYNPLKKDDKFLRRDFEFAITLGKDHFFHIFVTDILGKKTNQEVWKSSKPLNPNFDRLESNERIE
jgi:hypothetical protein